MDMEYFQNEFIRKSSPVILENCLDDKTLLTLENVTPEEFIKNFLAQESPSDDIPEHISWTHDTFPQEDNRGELRRTLGTGHLLRRFIKLTSLRLNTSCPASPDHCTPGKQIDIRI